MDTNLSARNKTPILAEWSKGGAASHPVRQACEVCRDRKVRCDRAVPKCGRCNRLRQPCGYRSSVASSRHDLPDQIQQLQDRLAKAEALLALTPNSTIARPAEMVPSPTTADLSSVGSLGPLRLAPPPLPLLSGEDTRTSDTLKTLVSIEPDFQTVALPLLDDVGGFANVAGISYESADWPSNWATLPVSPFEPISTNLLELDTTFPSFPSLSWDEQVPTKDLAVLHQEYFDIIYYSLPFLSKQRFYSEISQTPSSPAFLALKYAVALVGCTLSPDYFHLQAACYHTARNYMERCEREAEETNLGSLNLFQALLFIIRFEIMDQKLNRAWMTVGRAVRMSRMLTLHQMDRELTERKVSLNLQMDLPRTEDALLLEERRRAFWGLYILESHVRTRTGMECELGSAEIFDVYLPSPGLLNSEFRPAQMPFLRNLAAKPSINISSYAGCILMVELAIRCLDHGGEYEIQTKNKSFWDEHYTLIKTIDELIATLQCHMSADAICKDPVAFSVCMNLRATEILFHEAAIAQLDRQGLPALMAAESQKRSSAAAYKIASAVQLNWPSTVQSDRDIFSLQATFIAWPIVAAINTMKRDLANPNDEDADASGGIVALIRLLLSALDRIERPDGYWHASIAPVIATLEKWDGRSRLASLVL